MSNNSDISPVIHSLLPSKSPLHYFVYLLAKYAFGICGLATLAWLCMSVTWSLMSWRFFCLWLSRMVLQIQWPNQTFILSFTGHHPYFQKRTVISCTGLRPQRFFHHHTHRLAGARGAVRNAHIVMVIDRSWIKY